MDKRNSSNEQVTINDLMRKLNARNDYEALNQALCHLEEKLQVDIRVELEDAAGDYQAAYLKKQMKMDIDLQSLEDQLKAVAGNNAGTELIRAAQKDVHNLLENVFGRSK